ncbi:alpha/beta fold hydrolase [Hydrogenophaga sp. A37]|uniref:alpha/beta fold hydrolase n=1 Tax=Hydrogenophaga sp. A37 TaxID=1945864 RepID=UPI000986CC1C|nr:alpha/beta hydrolase [Hydrogenophaga sp. A37]OOG83155.1 alpha/beta hydrolase [Hydrogenophaga sp. A37]
MTHLYDAPLIGHGPRKVICLHGWFGHARGWGPLVYHLDKEAFSYAFLDQRGHGHRKGSGGPYNIAQIAQDALALADSLGWDRFALVGHSMGGLAIQHVLADAPQRVQALVGVTPVPASGVPFDEAGWAFFSAAAKDVGTRRAIIDLTTGNRLTGVWLDRMAQGSVAHSVEAAVADYLMAWAKTTFVERIQGQTLPVLVIAGANDPALGEATCRATWLQHYPNARLEVMPNAGHYPMDETPIALATAIERFLMAAMPG